MRNPAISPVLSAVLICWAALAGAFEIEEDTLFAGSGAGGELRILSTTDTVIFAPLLRAFQAIRPDVSIRYTVASSQEVYRALYEEGADYDLAISSAMDLQMKLANDGFAQGWRGAGALDWPVWAMWQDRLFAFAQEPVVLIVSRAGLGDLPVPRTRQDMINLMRDYPDVFRGRIGTYDPTQSGAGYMFATQDARQSDTFWRLAEVMGGMQPRLYATSGDMIADLQAGDLVMAYNVLGSYAQARLDADAGETIVALEDFTLTLLRTALIPQQAPSPELGGAFLGFMLSADGQRIIASETGLPAIDAAALAAGPHLRPIRLGPGLLVFVDPLKRQRFLDEWRAAVQQPSDQP